jgi:hypothetical protein
MHQFEKWRSLIVHAATPEALTEVLRQYGDCILPSDVATLPERCQVALETAHVDLGGSAVVLLQEELRYAGPPEAAALLHEIAQTFAAASSRLTQMQGLYPRD